MSEEFDKAAVRGRPASPCSPSSFFELRLRIRKPIKNLTVTVGSIISGPPSNLSQLNHLTEKEVVEHTEVLWLQIPEPVVQMIKAFDLAGAELREIDSAVEALGGGSNDGAVTQPPGFSQNGENAVNCVWVRLVVASVHVVKRASKNPVAADTKDIPENVKEQAAPGNQGGGSDAEGGSE